MLLRPPKIGSILHRTNLLLPKTPAYNNNGSARGAESDDIIGTHTQPALGQDYSVAFIKCSGTGRAKPIYGAASRPGRPGEVVRRMAAPTDSSTIVGIHQWTNVNLTCRRLFMTLGP